MANSSHFLHPGSAAQRQAVQGIANGHAFGKHGKDVPGADQREFGAAAMRDLNSADHVYEFEQDGGTNLLFTNEGTGMVGWINTTEPERSTYFEPKDGVEDYVANKVADISESCMREIGENEIAQIQTGLSPDHSQNFHDQPELSDRNAAARSAPESQAPETASDQDHSIDGPEAGDDGNSR